MSAPPSIPPRPARGQNSSAPSSQLEAPRVPPRPNRGDRSASPNPNRDTFAPSPLNSPYGNGPPPKPREVPSRPPSTSLPGLGEEGNEYASFEDLSKTLTNESAGQPYASPQQTSNIAGDLPLHAPKASVPASTAKSRIQTVTRTDSSQAEAAGFGRQLVPEDKTAKSARSGSSMGSRPSSIYNDKDEHGIPEIGVQVPMFRNAGDVQAPSPAPVQQQGPGGIGFHNKAGGRHHGRTKSGREIFHGPPGSYGMHGHGKISQDDFEKKWYERHPEDLKREKAGEYGPHIQENRKDYHWRADNLDQLVHGAGTQGIGLGTSREAVSTPDEQIGYIATEQYASRYTTPRPQSSGRPASIKAGVHVDSPLRQEAEPVQEQQLDDNGEVYHIDPPAHRGSKIHGGGYDPPTEDLGPQGGNTAEEGGWVTERGYGMPILASDELKKHPDSEWRQPAISPEMERRGDEYTVNEDGTPAYITKARPHSRNSSRNENKPQRVVPSPAQYDRGGTPLESHKEYEPLFPEDEEDGTNKPKSQVDKLKRPSVARHHFPSQDVWEDTPGSLQLQTTVETPEVPDEPQSAVGDVGEVSASKVFEKPETEEARKDNITKEDQQSFLPEHTRRFAAENKLLGKVRGEEVPQRPGMQQRFPSQDIWEDAPEHGQWETTVSTPQQEETNEYAEDSPAVEKPSVPARPQIPARPQKEESPIDKKAPIIPDRPKPQIPVRPAKSTTTARGEEAASEPQAIEGDASQPKAKPPVPARPGSSKIAALQAGFLKDLNSKLGLGPQAPKVKEPEPEAEPEPAAPLQDARKGRAKGPQRRKPAASPTPAATVTSEVAVSHQKLSIGPITAMWSIDSYDVLDVPAAGLAAKLQSKLQTPSRSEDPVADSPEAGLSKTLTQSSQVGEPLELSKTTSATSAAASDLPSELSKTISQGKEAASSLLGPDEALVTETAPGSVGAPGAFPGMDGSDEAAGGVSLEQPSSSQKPVAEEPSASSPSAEKSLGGSIADKLEKKKEEAPSTAGTVPASEGAGSTQSFAG
ncbi:hypothetical protein HBI56_159450 [Parastagonospora nodorum]|nr:hypothetical protein HBI10_182770 [Parastagonospora nodorum]KAH4014004.1 hypothetical protein HBI13_174870 [Parastagonospora nodorum]KAH4021986.1 hypothetical protein HBI09_174740 [Parastagonospora nodorum]KAH4093571.1 hypothetical protein HBH46_177420 [Parastagonospora nodorum]KAH4207360.1 hypothetical protein HBI95_115790 [Parastagonospora nodorum]